MQLYTERVFLTFTTAWCRRRSQKKLATTNAFQTTKGNREKNNNNKIKIGPYKTSWAIRPSYHRPHGLSCNGGVSRHSPTVSISQRRHFSSPPPKTRNSDGRGGGEGRENKVQSKNKPCSTYTFDASLPLHLKAVQERKATLH